MRTIILILALCFTASAQTIIFGGGKAAAIVGPRATTLPASCTTEGLMFQLLADDGVNKRGFYNCNNGYYTRAGLTGTEGRLLRFGASNSVGLTTGLLEDAAGKVGIETTSPTNTLDVRGTGIRVDGMYDQATTDAGLFLGRLQVAGDSGRILFATGTASQNWQIDNSNGEFRWFLPGVVHMGLTATTLSLPNKVISVTGTGNNYFAGSVGIGTTPARLLHASLADATTNAVANVARLAHTVTGGTAGAAGLGVGLEFSGETATDGINAIQASIETAWTTATTGAEDGFFVVKTMTAGTLAEKWRISSAGHLTGIATVNVIVPNIKSATGQRYVCVDTVGTLVSSAAACVGT